LTVQRVKRKYEDKAEGKKGENEAGNRKRGDDSEKKNWGTGHVVMTKRRTGAPGTW
jgi:hypothetical protein